ncbi:hypothetical protein HDE_10994 [Halotydeus destructor]|nr:hypothetical protein HDE_10994 [Halotydeus destructor]
MEGTRSPFLPMADLSEPYCGLVTPFDFSEYLHNRWHGMPQTGLTKEVYNGEPVEERVPGLQPAALLNRRWYNYLVTMLAPELLGATPVEPKSTLSVVERLVEDVMTPNDHFQCGRQGSLHAVGQHHCDHVPWCNKGYCAVIRYCEDENRLRHRPSFLITSYSFPWQHTCPGLWQIDYNHQIMLEKIPGIEEIVVSLNEDFRHTLTNAQQNLLKALNYNVYFVDFEDEYNFAFVMAPERIMMELRPEALDNFVEQVTQLYGRSVGDLSLIFKKLVDHGQYDVRAVAVETTNVHGRTMPFRDLKYKKVTSIEVLPKFSNFTREAKPITVSNEVIFCLSSKAKYISRQALKWFGHGKELFPNAERIDEPICFQVAAGQLDRVSTFIRYDRSLLGGHVRLWTLCLIHFG